MDRYQELNKEAEAAGQEAIHARRAAYGGRPLQDYVEISTAMDAHIKYLSNIIVDLEAKLSKSTASVKDITTNNTCVSYSSWELALNDYKEVIGE